MKQIRIQAFDTSRITATSACIHTSTNIYALKADKLRNNNNSITILSVLSIQKSLYSTHHPHMYFNYTYCTVNFLYIHCFICTYLCKYIQVIRASHRAKICILNCKTRTNRARNLPDRDPFQIFSQPASQSSSSAWTRGCLPSTFCIFRMEIDGELLDSRIL